MGEKLIYKPVLEIEPKENEEMDVHNIESRVVSLLERGNAKGFNPLWQTHASFSIEENKIEGYGIIVKIIFVEERCRDEFLISMINNKDFDLISSYCEAKYGKMTFRTDEEKIKKGSPTWMFIISRKLLRGLKTLLKMMSNLKSRIRRSYQ